MLDFNFLLPDVDIQFKLLNYIALHYIYTGARGVVVDEALRYNPEGRGFDCRMFH
jgi:hypothetical protein